MYTVIHIILQVIIMVTILYTVLSAVICYMIGSIPVAYILVKLVKGIDVRVVGSGNVGATNASRALGGWAFWVVLALDGLKGFLPVFILLKYSADMGLSQNTALIGALAVLLGHVFPVFLHFRGGKGVATGLGIFLALAPVPVLIGVAVFVVVLAVCRMVSLGSILAAITTAVLVTLLSDWRALWVFTWVVAALVIYKHKSNIIRILIGSENKMTFRKK